MVPKTASYHERILMHYRRFSPSNAWTVLSRQPTYRLAIYGAIVLLALWALFYSTSPSGGAGLSIPWPISSAPQFPVHYSPLVNVPTHVWENRAEQVKYAFQDAYGAYETYAAPHDELKPVNCESIDNFNGWGLTAFDSLDTMLIMGLDDEYQKGLEVVTQANFSVSTSKGGYAPFFETTIRYLGGLLAAYALSPNDTVLLERAIDLVEKLDPVFNSTSGLAYYSVNPTSGTPMGTETGILAEVASLQLEYTYLSKLTGRRAHFNRANNVMQVLSQANLSLTGGMLPVRWDINTSLPADTHLSVGAQADSAHEYLLKLYLLTAKMDKTSLEMYIRTTMNIIANLLYLSPTRNLLYVTDTISSTFERRGAPTHIFEHLSCFLPGLLGLAQTCWLTYADQPTGLAPDEVTMQSTVKEHATKTWTGDRYWTETNDYMWIDALDKWKKSGSRGQVPGLKEKNPMILTEDERLRGRTARRDYVVKKPGYLLRPETIESFFLLWKVTGDWKWRARGWAVFEAIQKETKTHCGYASLRTVERMPGPKDNSMPSYFLAETLKYLYLMFKEDDLIPLDQWVFNTEAHPLPVFQWTKEEREKFGITV